MALAQLRADLERAETLDPRKRIAELVRIRDRLTMLIGEEAIEASEAGLVAEDRCVHPGRWVARVADTAESAGRHMVAAARLARRYEPVAAGVDNGPLSEAHIKVLLRMLPRNRTPYRAEQFARDVGMIVELARELEYPDWVKACNAWLSICEDADPHAKAPEDKDLHVDFRDNLDGTTSLRGLMLTNDARALKEALRRIARDLHAAEQTVSTNESADPESADPEADADGDQIDFTISEYTLRPVLRRGHRYFMARAVGQLAALAASADGRSVEPLLVVLMDWQTFGEERARWSGAGEAHDPAIAFRPGYVCETLDGAPVDPVAAFRVALDHRVARCVINADSREVDLGRTQRLFTGAARDAVRWRDRHCQAAGCRRPARWCEADHIREWQDGGATNPANGQLLCPQHHRMKSEAAEAHRRHLEERRRSLPPEQLEPF